VPGSAASRISAGSLRERRASSQWLLRHLHAVITTGQRWDPVIAAGGRPSQTPIAA